MQNEFVTYEQALALKELGFDWGTYEHYDSHTKEICDIFKDVSAPLKQQIFRWFREKYGWYANLSSWIHEEEIGIYHEFEIYGNPNGVYGDGKYDTYEEAENACIDKLIELIKNK